MFWILLVATLVLAAVTYGAAVYVAKRGAWLVTDDDWLARDKRDHLALGFLVLVLWATLLWHHPVHLSWATALTLAGVETYQLVRLAQWIDRRHPPRQAETDGISWKDLVVGLVGALLAAGALWRITS